MNTTPTSHPADGGGAAAAVAAVDPLTVGSKFVKAYYNSLAGHGDASLTKFYHPKSCQVSTGTADDFPETHSSARSAFVAGGRQQVSRVDISAVDAQRIATAGGNILLVVTGKVVLSDSAAAAAAASTAQGFVQTFVLSPQGAKAFVVANDILRLTERDTTTTTTVPAQPEAIKVAPITIVDVAEEEKPPMQTPEPIEPLAAVVSPPGKQTGNKPGNNNNNNSSNTTQQQANGSGNSKSRPSKTKAQYQTRQQQQQQSAASTTTASPGHGTEESKEPVLVDDNNAAAVLSTTNGTATSTTTAKQPWGPRNHNNNNNSSTSTTNPHHHATTTTNKAGAGGVGTTVNKPYNNNNNTNAPSTFQQRDPDCTIIVKQLDETITSEEIRQVFAEYGEITAVSILANRGLAYVDFTTKEPVRRILAKDDFRIKERNVAVSAKLPKPPHYHYHVRGGGGRRPGGRFYRGGGDRGGGGGQRSSGGGGRS